MLRAEWDRDPDIIERTEDLDLKSISLSPGDHGCIVDQDWRTPRHIDALAGDREGQVYMVGSWQILPGEQGTRQMVWDKPTRELHVMKRGQYFACADVSADLR
jgi:hypothetical protein